MALILAMCGFSLAMSISPGPVNVLSVSSGSNHGFLRTLPFVSGATLGFTLLLFASGFGIHELLTYYAALADLLMMGGCAFIFVLGLKLAKSTNAIQMKNAEPPTFWQGFLLQWLNPKAWTACIAGVSAFAVDGQLSSLLLFTGIYFIICYFSIGLWAFAGARLRAFLDRMDSKRLFNGALGTSLCLIALFLIAERFLMP